MTPPSPREILVTYRVSEPEKTQLLTYNQNPFEHTDIETILDPQNEPYLQTWEQYQAQSQSLGVYETLKSRLIQFQFPIVRGISQTEDYRAATGKGKSVGDLFATAGLVFQQPEQLRLFIHPTLAGSLPVILAGDRADFVTLVQALTKKNEPEPIPDSMGACIVSGYNNWDRIKQYRRQWEINNPNNCSESDWALEFKKLIPKKELYQDRFILLSRGFYSNVSAQALGLTEAKWLELSLKIRLEHECTHYITRRWFGSMQNNIYDELIADYRGIVAALGYYRADWFLHFLGLESFPEYRQGGRLENYRGEPPLSDKAFKILQKLIKNAAENLERFAQQYSKQVRDREEEVCILLALTKLRLEELACDEAVSLLNTAVADYKTRLLSN